MPAHSIPLRDRFGPAYVHRTDGCWLWKGNRPGGRYGHTKFKGKTYLVHRLAYEFFVGAVPDGSWVLHECDNPGCVRPSHLFLGSPRDNVMDKINKGRGGFGDMHGRAVLTTGAVLEIRAAKEAARGAPWRHGLATKHGVSLNTISRAATGENWKRLAQ